MSIRANHLGPMKVDEMKMALKSRYTLGEKCVDLGNLEAHKLGFQI